jgi:thiamine pyrophosphokinase
MSSHHFVKDGQEPALIIANGQICSFEFLESLMQWSPLIVALDGAYLQLKEMEIKPDIVIGDMDSINHVEIDSDVQVIRDPNQENTDLEKAIEYLIKQGYKDINVVGAFGKRIDHSMNNFLLFCKYPNLNLVYLDDNFKAMMIKNTFKKYYNTGQIISLLPIGEVKCIESANLLYSLNNKTLSPEIQTGCSNEVAKNGMVTIIIEKGFLIIVEIFS